MYGKQDDDNPVKLDQMKKDSFPERESWLKQSFILLTFNIYKGKISFQRQMQDTWKEVPLEQSLEHEKRYVDSNRTFDKIIVADQSAYRIFHRNFFHLSGT